MIAEKNIESCRTATMSGTRMFWMQLGHGHFNDGHSSEENMMKREGSEEFVCR